MQPAWVDTTDRAFMEMYIQEFDPIFSMNLLGLLQCTEVDKLLESMSGRLILEREPLKLNPWLETNKKTKTWRYKLTPYAEDIISSQQDYFLNLMIKKMKKKQ